MTVPRKRQHLRIVIPLVVGIQILLNQADGRVKGHVVHAVNRLNLHGIFQVQTVHDDFRHFVLQFQRNRADGEARIGAAQGRNLPIPIFHAAQFKNVFVLFVAFGIDADGIALVQSRAVHAEEQLHKFALRNGRHHANRQHILRCKSFIELLGEIQLRVIVVAHIQRPPAFIHGFICQNVIGVHPVVPAVRRHVHRSDIAAHRALVGAILPQHAAILRIVVRDARQLFFVRHNVLVRPARGVHFPQDVQIPKAVCPFAGHQIRSFAVFVPVGQHNELLLPRSLLRIGGQVDILHPFIRLAELFQ